ncbi:hypothetical protein B7486_68870 [cyanobacterium TDX16]|nr:hypothetical protein B7486_68870 [cyanobacterium TDX16]
MRIWHIMAAVAASAAFAAFAATTDVATHWVAAYLFVGLAGTLLACPTVRVFCGWSVSFAEFAVAAALWPLTPLAVAFCCYMVWHYRERPGI